MEVLLVLRDFTVRSKFREYSVEFVKDFSQIVKEFSLEKTYFLVDKRIIELYRQKIQKIIPNERIIVVDANEQNKTLEYCYKVIEDLVGRKVRKDDILIAIGGGIVQDITAFISSIVFRGIDWMFIPTTLLAQSDSCIGSKTSINFGGYKNLLGNFYPPKRIINDISFLDTLSRDDIKSGIGEMLHYYFIAGSKYANQISKEYDLLFEDRGRLEKFIIESLSIKKPVVERDEFDKGERNLFNYGHTFGHAIESVTKYEICHGQAVTMGMDIANYISLKLKMINGEMFNEMHEILMKNIPQFCLDEKNLQQYILAISKDKKNIGSNLTCILTKGPGKMEKVSMFFDDNLRDLILLYFNQTTNI